MGYVLYCYKFCETSVNRCRFHYRNPPRPVPYVMSKSIHTYRWGIICNRWGVGYNRTLTVESFFSTLKKEHIYRHKTDCQQKMQLQLFEYIKVRYNRQRIHSSLDYQTPL